MPTSEWQLAEGTLTAYSSGTKLLIVADGKKPTPCHEVDIDVVPTTAPPSQYALRWRQIGPCTEVLSPYAYFELFDVSAYQAQIEVHTASGIQKVAVKPAGARTLTRATGAGVMASSPPAPPGGSRPRGQGRSRNFSFEEAFGNALKDLEEKTGGPKNFSFSHVVEIAYEFGGVTGAHDIVVTVE